MEPAQCMNQQKTDMPPAKREAFGFANSRATSQVKLSRCLGNSHLPTVHSLNGLVDDKEKQDLTAFPMWFHSKAHPVRAQRIRLLENLMRGRTQVKCNLAYFSRKTAQAHRIVALATYTSRLFLCHNDKSVSLKPPLCFLEMLISNVRIDTIASLMRRMSPSKYL